MTDTKQAIHDDIAARLDDLHFDATAVENVALALRSVIDTLTGDVTSDEVLDVESAVCELLDYCENLKSIIDDLTLLVEERDEDEDEEG